MPPLPPTVCAKMAVAIIAAMVAGNGPLFFDGAHPAAARGSESPELPATGAIAPPGDPLSMAPFLANDGQVVDARVRLFAPGGSTRVAFLDGAVALAISTSASAASSPRSASPPEPRDTVVLRLSFDGGRPIVPQGVGAPQAGVGFIKAPTADGRLTPSRAFDAVAYAGIWDGIDLLWSRGPGGLKYEFHAAPGADLRSIGVTVEGTEALTLEEGELVLHYPGGTLRDEAPISFLDNGRAAECAYALRGPTTFGFDCAPFDARRALVIDPLIYATYLGGTGFNYGEVVAAGPGGDTFVAGETMTHDFPTTPGVYVSNASGDYDIFVARINAVGTQLVYAAVISSSSDDRPTGIAVGPDAGVVVCGYTDSNSFPTTPGAFHATHTEGPSSYGGFMFKVSPDGGSLTFSTYLDGGSDVAVDSANTIFTNIGGGQIARFPPDGSAPLYHRDSAVGGDRIALDGAGGVYALGGTSTVSEGAYASPNASARDIGVSKLVAETGELVYVAKVGGSGRDLAFELAADLDGSAYIAGKTGSHDFPATQAQHQLNGSDDEDVFVVKLTPDGSALAFSAIFGGNSTELARGLAVDSSRRAHVAGVTWSPDFPTTPGALRDTIQDGEAFVTVLAPSGEILRSTFLGGSGWEYADSLDLDPCRNVYLTGFTYSTDFPVTPNAPDPTYSGDRDAFVAKLNFEGGAGTGPVAVVEATPPGPVARRERVRFEGVNSCAAEAAIASWRWTLPNGSVASTVNFTASFEEPGEQRVTLNVTDTLGRSAQGEWVVRVTNRAPVADAGPDIEVPPAEPFHLDATNSSDPEGDALSYRWELLEGRPISGGPWTGLSPTLAPNSSGVRRFALTVEDAYGAKATDEVRVAVGDRAPALQSATPEGNALTIGRFDQQRFTASYDDPDGDPIMYEWAVNGVPVEGNTSQFTFAGHGFGKFDVRVTASDGVMANSTAWELTVAPQTIGSPLFATLLLAALAALVLGSAAWFWLERRRASNPEPPRSGPEGPAHPPS